MFSGDLSPCLCPVKSSPTFQWCLNDMVKDCVLSQQRLRGLYPLSEGQFGLPWRSSSSLCPRCENLPSSNSKASEGQNSSFLLVLVISAWSHPAPPLPIFLPPTNFFFFFLIFSDFTFQVDVKSVFSGKSLGNCYSRSRSFFPSYHCLFHL